MPVVELLMDCVGRRVGDRTYMTRESMQRVAAELKVATPQAFRVIAYGAEMTDYEDKHPEVDSRKIPHLEPVAAQLPKQKRSSKPRKRRRSSARKKGGTNAGNRS